MTVTIAYLRTYDDDTMKMSYGDRLNSDNDTSGDIWP